MQREHVDSKVLLDRAFDSTVLVFSNGYGLGRLESLEDETECQMCWNLPTELRLALLWNAPTIAKRSGWFNVDHYVLSSMTLRLVLHTTNDAVVLSTIHTNMRD